MGVNFTDRAYPLVTLYIDGQGEESHLEPGSEQVLSSVKGFEHPYFSAKGMKDFVNLQRALGNSTEQLLTGEINEDTIKGMVQAAFKNQFPVDMLMMAADMKESLTDRSGMDDAQEIIDKFKEYATGFGRPPKNFELFMAFAMDGVDKAEELINRAKESPNEKAVPAGTKYDDILFFKPKAGEPVPRTNKEVLQFFARRINSGNDFFAHLPLGRNTNAGS